VASAGKAGNSSFSFAMEISGVVLKRSNFQLFFKDKDGRKTDLVQVKLESISYIRDQSRIKVLVGPKNF
jgi:hypothetical protein